MAERTWNLLVLCAGNATCSILAEALFNALGQGRLRAFSAGSAPRGAIHPLIVELLEAQGLPTAPLRSKSWDEFGGANAPVRDLDLIIRLERLPPRDWPASTLLADWPLADPCAGAESQPHQYGACRRIYAQLAERVLGFLSLPFETLPRATLQAHLAEIGRAGAAACLPQVAAFDLEGAP